MAKRFVFTANCSTEQSDDRLVPPTTNGEGGEAKKEDEDAPSALLLVYAAHSDSEATAERGNASSRLMGPSWPSSSLRLESADEEEPKGEVASGLYASTSRQKACASRTWASVSAESSCWTG